MEEIGFLDTNKKRLLKEYHLIDDRDALDKARVRQNIASFADELVSKGLSKADLEKIRQLSEGATPGMTLEQFRELLETCDAKRYAQLSEDGTLTRFIPEWERLTSDNTGWQHFFHENRLDEHTLRLLQYLDSSQEFKALPDKARRLLRVTALLHDIGKEGGPKEDRDFLDPDVMHPEKSAQMARQIMQRLKYTKEETDTVCKLIKHHDALGNISIYGDIGAKPDSPGRFKVKHSMSDLAEMFSRDEITMLKILTKADIRAIRNSQDLLRETNNFYTFREGKSGKKYTTEKAIDMSAEQVLLQQML
jgi:hypothetical protein